MFETKDLGFSYGMTDTLRHVNLKAEAGKLHAIAGPNGAGKSTLIRLLAGLLTPHTGEVTFCGERIADFSDRERARAIAYMAQDTTVPGDFTAKEIVEMARYARTGGDDEKAVLAAMERTRTLSFSDRKVGELSGGERQRVLLARAFAQGTDALLLDEVTSALDLHYQLAVMEDLRDWLTPERTILMVLHDINLAARYADEIWMMQDRTIAAHGKPAAVIQKEMIQRVYRVDSVTERNPVTGSPIVIPVERREEKLPLRVFVIAGGGSGRALYAALYRLGADVTTGVLNAGDSDHTLAQRLGFHVREVPAFAEVAARDIANIDPRGVDAVLLSNLPVGPGNRWNLELAARLGQHAPLLYCPWQVGTQYIHKDYETDWQRLIADAVFCPDEEALEKELRKR